MRSFGAFILLATACGGDDPGQARLGLAPRIELEQASQALRGADLSELEEEPTAEQPASCSGCGCPRLPDVGRP